MVTKYQPLLDMLKPQEEEPMMSQMTPEQLSSLQQVPVQTIPENYNQLAQEEALDQPVAEAVPAAPKQTQPSAPVQDDLPKLPMQDIPLSKSEALLAEYQKMLGKDQESLAEARRRDRMLKMGGAIGDALATVINARSQMNVKAPGVQVQQGAGLGEIAGMFATAPEIQSDVAARREALLRQYSELAKGERAQLDRDLRERQIAAYEAQTRAQARKAEADTAKSAKTEAEKPTIGEQTVDKEFAKKYNEWRTGGKADYEENKKIFDEAINALEKGKVSTGTTSGLGARLPGIRTEARELETRVRKAVNGMLRATLGAQFTEEEGKRIFEQTFDPFASPQENIKNMQTELNRIEKRARDIEQQGQYFIKQKTLSGFESQETPLETPKKRREIRQGDNIFDADTKEFIRKANP